MRLVLTGEDVEITAVLEALLGLFALLALRHNRGAKPCAKVVGKLVKLGIAINLDGLLGGVADHIAVVAPGQMILEFGLGPVIEDAVQIICQLLQEFRAFHFWPSPLSRFLKYRLRRSRNCRRARNNLDFTAGMLRPKASAVSSVERPSTSLRTNTVRKLGGKPWMVRVRMSFNSACL